MDHRDFDIIDVKAGLEEENSGFAQETRRFCASRGIYLINLMASPGAGKTTVLCRLIDILKDRFTIGVIEADVDADVDAVTVTAHGAKAVQLHTGGSCHMDGRMTLTGIKALGPDYPRVIVLENIGNLVCPAEFDVGADLKLMILSVPEGDDKPLKYPLMFTVSECMLVNKIDTAEIFDFDLERCRSHVRKLNDKMPLFPVSGKTGEGMREAAEWLAARIAESGKVKQG
ncbi:MAG: hydrogenase nickel incorporation protein HypB [Lachnospiraceae bacterium]|nr:hydrogenase nickel incorporation protein HypB [Lachnospiraceae bacterium]